MSSGASADFDTDKVNVELPVDMRRMYRVAQKIMVLLHKKCPDMFDAYFVALVLVAFFEECEGCFVSDDVLSELRDLVARDWKAI